jgi:antitoxin YefM
METSYTHARAHLAELCDKAIDDCETVIIHRRGKPDVALIAADELSGLMETLHLLGSPDNARWILQAGESLERGEGQSLSISELARAVGLEQAKSA